MRIAALAVLAFTLLAACGGRKPKPIRLPPPMPGTIGTTQHGVASWYGHPYHGRRTSNGEVYDMRKMTAAHLALPFDTWVRVTNQSNGLATKVRINDRGPFVKGRIIDLSEAAAEEIDMIGPGTARVQLEVVEGPTPTSGYVVQIGSFGERTNADELLSDLNRLGYEAELEEAQTDDGVRFRVLVVPGNSSEAEAILIELRGEGFEGFVRSRASEQ